jgi:hypothetical protein
VLSEGLNLADENSKYAQIEPVNGGTNQRHPGEIHKNDSLGEQLHEMIYG